jgi:hypothetical protein
LRIPKINKKVRVLIIEHPRLRSQNGRKTLRDPSGRKRLLSRIFGVRSFGEKSKNSLGQIVCRARHLAVVTIRATSVSTSGRVFVVVVVFVLNVADARKAPA